MERLSGVGGMLPMNLNRWRLGKCRARSLVRFAALPACAQRGVRCSSCCTHTHGEDIKGRTLFQRTQCTPSPRNPIEIQRQLRQILHRPCSSSHCAATTNAPHPDRLEPTHHVHTPTRSLRQQPTQPRRIVVQVDLGLQLAEPSERGRPLEQRDQRRRRCLVCVQLFDGEVSRAWGRGKDVVE